ncbi:MAG: C39 family peptidase [Candidatus Deferrimicrobiaceae bacterium]
MTFIPSMTRIALGVVLLAVPSLAQAGSVLVPGLTGGNMQIRVTSMKEAHFRSTIRQKYDFSCGSASLATLLTFHYEDPISEQDVFDDMFNAGDKEKIRKEGFSLLDMKKYLESRGYTADGYKATLDKLAAVGVPAITLLNMKGFKHFVVIKGVAKTEVLVGDPSAGAKVIPRDEFETMWNGILFLIRSNKNIAANYFNRKKDWRVKEKSPLGMALNPSDLANITLLAPGRAGL